MGFKKNNTPEIFHSNPFYPTGCLAFFRHNDILHPVLSGLPLNPLIVVEKLNMLQNKSVMSTQGVNADPRSNL